MNHTLPRLVAAASLTCAPCGSALFAQSAPPDGSRQELLDRIAELESKSQRDDSRTAELESRLSALETERGEGWLTERRADEVRQLVLDVLADADTRASMLQGSLTAGYDDGFIISSADGNWLLRTNFLMQQRLVVNRQSDGPGDDSRWGFENSRTKFILSGNVVSPDWFYKVEVEVGSLNTGYPNGETRTGLGDSYAGYDFGQGWRVWIGTFKTPLLREELVDAGRQLAVERSLVNYLYTGGRTDGIAVEYRNDQFRVVGSYNNGIDDAVYGGGVMTGGTSPLTSGTADFGFTGRAEWLMSGNWRSMDQFTSPAASERAMMLGGAIHYQSASTAATGADLDLLMATADFSAQFDGSNLFAAVIFGSSDPKVGSGVDTVGIVVQGGMFFAEGWEAFARYEWSDTDTLTADDISIVTLGVNKYIKDHNAKWTTDFGFGLEPVPVTVSMTGWRADSPDEDTQFVVRSQLQILY